MVNILEGESLINDGTALVIYRAAIAAVGGSFSLLEAGASFVLDAAGGILIGLVVGKLIAEFRRRIDDPPVEVTLSLLSGYAGYVPAERIGASGVLAAVTVGIYVGWLAPDISTARMRLQGSAMWDILTFLLNALLFVLIGLQLPRVIDRLGGQPSSALVLAAIAVCLVVIGCRMVWVHAVTFLIRAIDRRAVQRARRGPWRERVVASWAGMRGAVSLAAALALTPGFPARDEILFITFAVIFATLVAQGLTLPLVIRWAHVRQDDGDAREDLMARRVATTAALARLDELALVEWTRDDTIERMRALYRYRERRLEARAGDGDGDGDEDYEHRSLKYQKVVRQVIAAQRAAVVELRNRGDISNEVMHRIERELDLEDERLEI
jgi:CPA1 family monovalent cation:H+ antiporter